MSVNERFMKINRSKIRPGFLTGRHPVSLLVFFVCVTGISMFSKNPAVLFMSMFFSITSLAKLKGLGGMLRFLRTMLVLALLTAVINPLFIYNDGLKATGKALVNDKKLRIYGEG